jgi:hypothetical protein
MRSTETCVRSVCSLEALESRRLLDATISGRVFEDSGNGAFDVNDRPRAGDIVGLRDGNTFLAATTTDAEGRYTLTTTGSGSATLYHIWRWKGKVNIRYSAQAISYTDGQTTTRDIATDRAGRIWGTAITDENLNGQYNGGEKATVGYIFVDQNDDWKSDGIWAASNADGHYEIDDLPPGDYRLRASQTARRMLFPRDSHQVTLSAGQSRGHFPFFLSPVGGIYRAEVNVFDDDNVNGQHDLNKYVIENHYRPGLTVFVDGNGNGTRDPLEPSALTNSQGDVTFNGLQPGTHRIMLQTPEGVTVTTPGGAVQTVTVGPGLPQPRASFGLTGLLLLRGRVFHDAPDGAEPLVNQQVYLDFDRDDQRDANEPAVRTNASGVFTIGPLRLRDWQIGLVDMPAGAAFYQGSNLVRPTDGIVDIPLRYHGSISGLVFTDTNENGMHDDGEPAAANQPVWYEYAGGMGSFNGVTIYTGNDGRYLIPNVVSGRKLQIGIGIYLGDPPPVTLPAGGSYLNVSVLSGEDKDDLDFGLEPA